MFLHRLYPNLRNREARRDLADPYAMHQTLCRAFVPPEKPMPPGMILWRLEAPFDQKGRPILLVQSGALSPDWIGLCEAGWLEKADPPLNLTERLELDRVRPGAVFRFRLRANPSKCVNRKRLGLLRRHDQEKWLERVGQERGGFSVPLSPSFLCNANETRGLDVRISEETMLRGRKRGDDASHIRIFSVLFEGLLTVEAPELFLRTLANGIGHGKAMGLGLLSIAPLHSGRTASAS